MSTNQMLISIYAVLFAVAVIARALAGPIPDLAAGDKAGFYALAKTGAPLSAFSPEVQMAVSDVAPGR